MSSSVKRKEAFSKLLSIHNNLIWIVVAMLYNPENGKKVSTIRTAKKTESWHWGPYAICICSGLNKPKGKDKIKSTFRYF